MKNEIKYEKTWYDYFMLIIACASLKNLDIVVSNDTKTMLNELAIKAYTSVNEASKIKLPNFITYEEFKAGVVKNVRL